MKLKEILCAYIEAPLPAKVIALLRDRNIKNLHAKGLLGSASALLAASVYQVLNRPMLIICENAEEARYFSGDVEQLCEGKTINFFPSSYKRSFQPETLQNQLVLERAEVLNRLNQHFSKNEWVITSAEAICEWVMSEKDLNQNTYEVKQGDAFDLEFFIEFLTEHHFERTDFVYEPGTFSIRGGIIDVFSFSNDQPYRIELNGDTIEAIRIFNPIDQLSIKKVDRFFIIPNVQKEIKQKQSFFDYLQ
jgi:transcription-repair coupling factor (superfamily II helicase)